MGRNPVPELPPSPEPSKLEESYNRTLAIRSVGLSPLFQPLAGFSATQLRADVLPERYEPQINPLRHTLTVSSNVVDAEMQVDGLKKRAIYKPGDFSLIPRGSLTNGYCHTPSEFVHLQIEPSCLELICLESDGPTRIELLPMLQGRDELLRHLAHVLVGELNKGSSADTLYAEILARALVAHIAKNHSTRAARQEKNGRLTSTRLGAVRDYIAENLGASLRLEHLARVAGVSPSKLHRYFKSSTGETLHQYVMRQRVNRAKELLAGSRLPIADIASLTGFADQSHLTRVLKQSMRLTPKMLRRD